MSSENEDYGMDREDGNANLMAAQIGRGNNITAMAAHASEENNTAIVSVDDIGRLKKKYGEIYQIDVVVGGDDETEGENLRYIFKKPNTASFNRYLKTASKNMSVSTTAFVMDNIIDEQSDEFTKQSESYPGLALNIGTKLLNALGLGDNINFKRL